MREEVNAWASYEETAKTPRRLSAVNLRQRRQSASISASRHRAVVADSISLSHHRGAVTTDISLSHHRSAFLPKLPQQQQQQNRSISSSCHPSIDLSRLGGPSPPSSPPRTEVPPFFQQALRASQQGLRASQQGRSPAAAAAAAVAVRSSGIGASVHNKAGLQQVPVAETTLDENVLEKIRTTFDVFFEGAMYHDDEGNNKTSSQSLFSYINATMPWIPATFGNSPIVLFVDLCLRGIGQVVFQNSPLTGLLILIGLFIQSPLVAIHGVLSLVTTNGLSILLGFDRGLVGSGLFGYNAVLVGLALATFNSNDKTLVTLIFSVIIACFTSILFVMMGKLLVPYKSPPLTLPFNVATMLFLLSTANMGRVHYGSVRTPALPTYYTDADANAAVDEDWDSVTASQFFAGTIRGLGQVFLADHLAAGFLVLIGMMVCSRISACAALIGSAMGAAVAIATGSSPGAIEFGMFGFNPSLSVTAMLMFYSPSVGASILAIFAGIMTVVAQQALATVLEPWGLPFMTLPFCVVSLPFIIIQGTTSIVIAVPLASMTVPEDHLRVLKMLDDGFAFLKEALMELPDGNGKVQSKEDDEEEAARMSSSSSQRLSKMHSRTLTKSLSVLSKALDEADEAHGGGNKTMQQNGALLGGDKSLEKTKQAALVIYRALVLHGSTNHSDEEEGTMRMTSEQQQQDLPLFRIIDAFRAAGLNDPEALDFATLILTFIDLDDSGSIDRAEFVAFALVCSAMKTIRGQIVKFLDFVDENGNGMVSFEEIDAALQYLGQPVLDDDSRERLLELTRIYGYNQQAKQQYLEDDLLLQDDDNNNSDEEEMDVMELVNALTIAKVKAFTSAFHGCDSTASLGKDGWNNSERKVPEGDFFCQASKDVLSESMIMDVEC